MYKRQLLNIDNCYARLNDIVYRAYLYGMTVRLDMEDSTVTQDTIDLAVKLRKQYPNIGIALQSNLYRTDKDLTSMMEKGIAVRLVKGAYKEHITKAYQRKDLLHNEFFKQALRLLTDRCRSYYYYRNDTTPTPALGTHDEKLLNQILGQLNKLNIKKHDLIIEMLYGIRRDLSFSLQKEGYSVRLYVPFGTDWLPYTLRRLREFKNLKFVVSGENVPPATPESPQNGSPIVKQPKRPPHLNNSYSFERFIEGPNNQFAKAAAQ